MELKERSIPCRTMDLNPEFVISRGINKHVTERPEENENSIHYEEVAFVAVKPAAKKHQEQFMFVLIFIFIYIFITCYVDRSTEIE